MASNTLNAKHEAHAHYEVIRERLPELCKGTRIEADELESFISGRLNNSALDSAVAALSLRADGLFLYAHLLAEHLERAGGEIDFGSLDALPAGLGEVYACLLYTSPSPRDGLLSRMPSSA